MARMVKIPGSSGEVWLNADQVIYVTPGINSANVTVRSQLSVQGQLHPLTMQISGVTAEKVAHALNGEQVLWEVPKAEPASARSGKVVLP